MAAPGNYLAMLPLLPLLTTTNMSVVMPTHRGTSAVVTHQSTLYGELGECGVQVVLLLL